MITTAIIYGVFGLFLGFCIGAIAGYHYAENSAVGEFREGTKEIMKILNEIDAADREERRRDDSGHSKSSRKPKGYSGRT